MLLYSFQIKLPQFVLVFRFQRGCFASHRKSKSARSASTQKRNNYCTYVYIFISFYIQIEKSAVRCYNTLPKNAILCSYGDRSLFTRLMLHNLYCAILGQTKDRYLFDTWDADVITSFRCIRWTAGMECLWPGTIHPGEFVSFNG